MYKKKEGGGGGENEGVLFSTVSFDQIMRWLVCSIGGYY